MEKNSKLMDAIKLINKKFAKENDGNSIISLDVKPINKITSGSIAIDAATNSCGIPEGRIYEFFGRESSGKTTIALIIAQEYLKNNKNVLYIDAEQAFDPDWAKKIGVNVNNENFILVQEYILENVFNIMQTMIEEGDVKLVIVDSLASLAPKDDRVIDDPASGGMPVKAKILNRLLRIMTPIAAQYNANIIFINHEMEDIGKMGFGQEKFTTPGGRALKFFASMRLRVIRIGSEKDEDGVKIENRIKINFVKNKVGKPFGESELTLNFDKGLDKIREIMDFAVNYDIIKKINPRKYEYNGEVIATSTKELKNKISSDLDLQKVLKDSIYNKMKNKIILNNESDIQNDEEDDRCDEERIIDSYSKNKK